MTPMQWLIGDDTGTSSKVIFSVMERVEFNCAFGADTPRDCDDFGRCFRLLLHFPTWRARLCEVAARHPNWAPLVDAWNEISALYEQICDCDGYLEFSANVDVARVIYKRLDELMTQGRLAAGWKQTSPGSWLSPSKQFEISFISFK